MGKCGPAQLPVQALSDLHDHRASFIPLYVTYLDANRGPVRLLVLCAWLCTGCIARHTDPKLHCTDPHELARAHAHTVRHQHYLWSTLSPFRSCRCPEGVPCARFVLIALSRAQHRRHLRAAILLATAFKLRTARKIQSKQRKIPSTLHSAPCLQTSCPKPTQNLPCYRDLLSWSWPRRRSLDKQ